MTTQDNTIHTAHHPEPPLSGLVSGEPSETLYNVYNVMELMMKNLSEDDESCSDFGLTIMRRECMNAIAYEAERAASKELKRMNGGAS